MPKDLNYISVIFILLFFSSCSTPIYKKVDVLSNNKQISSREIVEFSLDENFNPNKVNCIAIGKISDNTNNYDYEHLNKSKLIRNALFGLLSTKNYEYINLTRTDYILDNNQNISNDRLLELLNCDAIINGKITTFTNNYLVLYSFTSVGIELELTDKFSKVLWSAKHSAISSEGSIPVSPISLVTGILEASSNREDETVLQMVDTVSRRVMSTLPNKQKIVPNNEFFAILNKDQQKLSTIYLDNLKIQNFIETGQYEQALIESKISINLNPSVPENYYFASKSEFLLKNYKSSIDFGLSAIAKGYNDAEIYSILGSSYLKEQENKLAFASFDKAIKLNPQHSMTNYNYAVINEIKNNIKTSANYYYLTGLMSLEENNNLRLYKSLKALKRLSTKNVTANEHYNMLGIKVSNFIKTKLINS